MENNNPIPSQTLEALARNFYREGQNYGFDQVDFVRFVNRLLDISMSSAHQPPQPPAPQAEVPFPPYPAAALPICGQRLAIRAYQAKDHAVFRQWLDDDQGRYFLLSRSTAVAVDFEVLINDKSNVIGIVTDLKDQRPIGSVAYLNCDSQQRKGELRKLIGNPKLRGSGLGAEATRLWINYGWQALNLRKIYLTTLFTHFNNIKINKELGFEVEGILRNEVFFDGRYHDVLRMGLLRP